ncbi:HsdS protein [Burkholderia pseudomallei]|nr:restriction endonuclease subunit S [Burkholderia thailandensis]CAJ3981731.1 HsdS protein [Burkholderia pseudomallei]CAJ8062590.1 HsdS protein [Burkholderia pseudomallei]CAJ9913333.1 HsdS protein [Burkholderia pseudomallei]CAK0568890.1 HsdS protein [Burkholderia pseudomallei]
MRSERSLESRTGGRAATTGVIPGDCAISVGNPGSALPDGWSWRLLTDVARLETGHTPSRKHPEYWGGDVPWIGIRDATGNHGGTLYKTLQYTNEIGIRNSSARILPANTVCLSRTASVGYVVVMGAPMATSQDFVNWVCGPGLDYRFLKYVLLGERGSFLRFASGTTHQTIYFPEVKAFHIALPPLETQRRIADVLGSLDDRIDLLRQTNATLESIAQALFKSWFIDLDPVRAKAEGREPEGIDAETAGLFPDAIDTWLQSCRRVTVRDAVSSGTLLIGDGYRAKNSELGYPGIAFVRAGDLLNGCITPTEDLLSLTALDKAKSKMAKAGDTAFTSKGTIGRFAYVDSDADDAVYSPQVCFWRSLNSTELPPEFLHFWMKSRLFSAQVDMVRGQAAIMDFVSLSDQRRMLLDMPPRAVQQRFSEIVQPILKRISGNRTAARILIDLRDTLLLRLISGKHCLPEVEAELNEVSA